MRTLTVVSVLLFAALLFAACEKDITDPASVQPGEAAAASLEKSDQRYQEGLPFFGTNWMYIFDGYGMYHFYVADPSVIPADQNLVLLEGPTPEALAYPQTVVSSSHWTESFPYAPKNFHTRGVGPVVFWFFSAEDAQAMLEDHQLTRAEMESYGPLKGYATMFREDNLVYPATTYSMTAQGELEGGGTFHVNAHERYYGPGPFDAKWEGNIILRR